MDTAEIRRKVRCGACKGPLRFGHINMIQLDRRATWKFPAAGNVLTGEDGRAIAVVCDGCLKRHKPIVEAVEFAGDRAVYRPVAELEELPPMRDPDA